MFKPVIKALSIMPRTGSGSLENRFLRFTLCVIAIICGCYLPAAGQKDTGTTLTKIGADTTLNKPRQLRKAMDELGEKTRGTVCYSAIIMKKAGMPLEQAGIIDQIKRITLQASDCCQDRYC